MRRAPAAAALALCAAALCAGRVRVPFGESLFFTRGGAAELPAAHDCERCHQEVYREWADSLHARSWRSEAFEQASSGRRAEECLACHAPEPFRAEEPLQLREAHREEGVTCVSCHLAPGSDPAHLTMRGPVSRSSPIEVHPVIEGDASYRSSELCGTCHRATLAQWRRAPDLAGEEKETCQGCHMPEVRRKVESVNDQHTYSRALVALERGEDLRRHAFAVPDDADRDLDLSARLDASSHNLVTFVTNRLPHALPTGQFGRRQLALAVRWSGGEQRVPLVASAAQALAPGETRSVTIALPANALAAPLHLSLLRYDHALAAWSEIASADLSPDAG